MPSKSKVCFFFESGSITLKNRRALKAFIERVFKKEKRTLKSLNYIFCSDKRLLEINKQFLQHNYYTDIITFDLSDNEFIQAEIYISTDRVRENAKMLGKTFQEEIHRVIFHGVLHLCGYKDKSEKDRSKMRLLEDKYLAAYF